MFSVKKNVKEIIEIWCSEDSGKEKNKLKKKEGERAISSGGSKDLVFDMGWKNP